MASANILSQIAQGGANPGPIDQYSTRYLRGQEMDKNQNVLAGQQMQLQQQRAQQDQERRLQPLREDYAKFMQLPSDEARTQVWSGGLAQHYGQDPNSDWRPALAQLTQTPGFLPPPLVAKIMEQHFATPPKYGTNLVPSQQNGQPVLLQPNLSGGAPNVVQGFTPPPDKNVNVAPGATVFDPNRNKAVYTAPQAPQMQVVEGQDETGIPTKYAIDLRNPAKTPTPLLQATPKGGAAGGLGNRGEVMFQRVIMAGNNAAQTAQNIMELPMTTTGGLWGSVPQGTGMLSAPLSALTNKMTSQEVQEYIPMMAGVNRNLAQIEAAGLMPSGTLTHAMDALQLREGDTYLTKMRKLAEFRQIVEKGLETYLDNPKLAPEQKAATQKIIGQMSAAIPFTHHDVTTFERAGQGNPETTFGEYVKSQGLGSSTGLPAGWTVTRRP